ncbi:patatin-like phospholipase family protein, partial [Photobacterium sanctipauli]
VFNEGPLLPALLASAAYPGMFTPVEIDGKLFSDGGITNNFPTDLINDQCQAHLGMYLSPLEHKESDEFANAFDVLDRVFEIYSSAHLLKSMKLPDVCIAPEGIDKWGAFNVDNESLQQLYDLGYDATKSHFEHKDAEWLADVKQSLDKKSFLEYLTS